MKLKICGIRNHEMLNFCQKNAVDFCGFNFVPTSKRKINLKFMQKIPTNFLPQKVGIFMDQSVDEIMHILDTISIDIIQLHGNESVSLIEKIKQKYPDLIIWKVFCINKNFNPQILKNYQNIAELFLFDAHTPGSGKTIPIKNHPLLQVAIEFCEVQKIPYALAGGISSKNIKQLKEKFPQAQLFDTASGVEIDGIFNESITQELIDLTHSSHTKDS